MQALGHFSEGSQDAVWILALERGNPQIYKSPETLYTLLFYPVKRKVDVVFFCQCLPFLYIFFYKIVTFKKSNVIGQTEFIITPQCTQPMSHACITYQHLYNNPSYSRILIGSRL